MVFQKELVIVRYRDEEHVRFELPAGLCEGVNVQRLVEGMQRIEGVYRVDLFPRQRKLSVRFMATVVDVRGVARGLLAVLEMLEGEQPGAPPVFPAAGRLETWREKLRHARSVRWAKEKYQELRETAMAAAILARAGKKKPSAFLPNPDTMIDFFTDMLVLYVIKTHWRMIVYDWMRRPWQYKYEWSATFYMIFLLVRSRIPQPR